MLVPIPLALVDEFIDAVELEPLGLGANRIRRGQLIDRDFGRDVLGARIGEIVTASLVTSMVQSEKFGTSIGETLRVFALSLRIERTQKAEEAAEKMAVKMLFPMVCFIFPVVLIVAVGPAAITMVEIFSN